MLELQVASVEAYDEKRGVFVSSPAATLTLEHSLLSLSKWESKWKIPWLGRQEKTPEQILDYIRIMNSAPDIDPQVFDFLTKEQLNEIFEYMNDPHTATTFPNQRPTRGPQETITSELIYYWMSQANVPFSCETWHLQRLLTLLRVHSVKNAPKKKMSKSEIMAQHRALNEQRRREMAGG